MRLDRVHELAGLVLDEVERAVVGKRDALELVLLGFLANGHLRILLLCGRCGWRCCSTAGIHASCTPS